MTITIQSTCPVTTTSPPTMTDFEAIKQRQQAAWSSGDYATIGVRLQIVGESLCEAVDLRAGERVLDVAAGNGNATLAAARRFADVVSTDYVPQLLDRGRERAEAERLPVEFQVADAERLPFDEGRFDAVLSSFGVMFTPDQRRAAREMLRVTRPGGRIGLANWTPDGFIGQLFRTIGRHVPPPPGVSSPAAWGTETFLVEAFGPQAADIRIEHKHFNFRFRSARHWIDMFRTWYGPVLKAFAALDAERQAALDADLEALLARFNRAGAHSLVVPSEYVEAVVTRA
jgi:SAM-dependent methyltransferase